MSHGITTVPSNLIWCLQSSHCFLLDNVIEFYWVKKKFYVYSIVCRVETQQFKTHYQNFQILWVFFSNKFSIIPVPCTKHVDLQVTDVFQFSLLLLEILGCSLINVYYTSSFTLYYTFNRIQPKDHFINFVLVWIYLRFENLGCLSQVLVVNFNNRIGSLNLFIGNLTRLSRIKN